MQALKAKVFISCGQRRDAEEVEVARAIAKVLEDLGFDPYIAIQEQTLRGLKENIFSQLTTSEYLLFVDFPREKFADSSERRGSLFSHQELAIASYLDLPVIAFQQKGVKPLDGMLGILQANAIPFDDAKKLPEMVRQQVDKAGWRADWKNALAIRRTPAEFDDARIVNQPGQPNARFFHLTVENLNPYKPAVNCTAYVEGIRDLRTNLPVTFRTAELKWAGYVLPSVAIMPASSRELDAFFVLHDNPLIMQYNCFTDSGYFMRPICGPGQFRLDYLIVSENFPQARISVTATVGNTIADATLA
jgi:hypothetical protein